MKRVSSVLAMTVLLSTFSCRKETTSTSLLPPRTTATTDRSSTSEETLAADSSAVPKENFRVGSAAPGYAADFLAGSRFRVTDYRGRVLLLNVWATWCGPCRYELPVLRDLRERHRSEGLEIVGVSIDEADMKEGVRRFVDKERINYPVALDPGGTIADLLETTVIPTSVLIDRQGRVVWYHQGLVEKNDSELSAALKKAL